VTVNSGNIFDFIGDPGGGDLADYMTKHHAPAHHQKIWAEFITKVKDIQDARRQALKNQDTQQQASINNTAKWSYKGVLDYQNTVATY